MSGLDPKDNTAMCPQCRTEMVHVAVTPHPVVRNMQRNTFVCYTCKRTRTYMLPGTFTPETREGAAAQMQGHGGAQEAEGPASPATQAEIWLWKRG